MLFYFQQETTWTISTLLQSAIAQLWAESQNNSEAAYGSAVRENLQSFHWHCLQRLQPKLADMAAQQISTVLWSSAKIGLSPDDCEPGMVHALTTRFLVLIDLAPERQKPNAQECSNLAWALATMAHPAATKELLDLCAHALLAALTAQMQSIALLHRASPI